MSAPTIKRLTDLSQATIDGAASVYDEAFDAASFYPVSYIWGDLPDEEKRKRQHVLFQQYVYRSISNHEMYAAYLTGSTEPDAVLVLKLPVDDGTAPNEELPTPYDAAVIAYRSPDVLEREKRFNERREALKKASWGPEHKRDYHVMFVGTRPKAQNKGLASAMIRIGLERAKKDGREASLTTHSEERFYLKRHGFKIEGHDEWDLYGTKFTWYCMTTDMANGTT